MKVEVSFTYIQEDDVPLVSWWLEDIQEADIETPCISPTHSYSSSCFLPSDGYHKSMQNEGRMLDLKDTWLTLNRRHFESKVCVYAYIFLCIYLFCTGPGGFMVPRHRVFVICGLWCFQHSSFLGRFHFHWVAAWNTEKYVGLGSRGVDSCLLLPCFHCEFLSNLLLWLCSCKRGKNDFIFFCSPAVLVVFVMSPWRLHWDP